jgi:hypothetical protein
MTANQEACRHFLIFFLGVKDNDKPGKLVVIYYIYEKKTRVKKKQIKIKVDVHLFATNALVIFWRSIFCNTTSATSSTTLL